MRIRIENKVSLILILMSVASLVSMLATLNIDRIINHDLYNYGLQFATNWAVPYWTMAATVFSMGWLIILASVGFELHMVVHRPHGLPEPEAGISLVLEELAGNEGLANEAPRTEAPRTEAPRTEAPRTEVEKSDKLLQEEEAVKTTAEEGVKTTALAVKTDDDMSEFRVLLEEILMTTNARVENARTRTIDKQTEPT